MFSQFARLIAVVSLLAASSASGAETRPVTGASSPSTGAGAAALRSQVLLLRDGRTFVGSITPGKDTFRVQVDEGFVQVPAKEVEGVFADMRTAYAERRRRLPPNQAAVHLELSKWCLGHRLLVEAEQELQTATRLEPNLAELDVVRRRLEWTTKQRTQQPASEVRGESSLQAAAPFFSSAPPAESVPRDADLDRLVRGLSAGVTSDFTTYIQPSLLNRCATAACHAATSDHGPKLVRSNRHGQLPRRVTLRNLEETLAYVDRARPSESLLLKKAAEPHGGSKIAVLDRNHLAYRQLSQWVRRVSGASVPNLAPVVAGAAVPLMATPQGNIRATAEMPLESDNSVSPADKSKRNPLGAGSRQAPSIPWVRELLDDEPADAVPVTSKQNEVDELTAEIEADMANDPFAFDPPANRDELLGKPDAASPFIPVDAFDPEIFNRQFSTAIQPEASVTGPTEAGLSGGPDLAPSDSGDSPR